MKPNSIILRGGQSSGKTYLSQTISSLFEPEKVLTIDACFNTLVYIARQIQNSNYNLIIFEDCENSKRILEINTYVFKFLSDNEKTVRNMIYITQDENLKDLEGFKIIECTFDK